MTTSKIAVALTGLICVSPVLADPIAAVDLATVGTDTGLIQRVFGSVGDGNFGVPVADGFNMDGDSH